MQVNEDGFDKNYGPTANGTHLLVFDNALYAFNEEDGLFRMSTTPCISWTPLAAPASSTYTYEVVNGVLYAIGASNELWQVKSGASLGPLVSTWQAVVSFFPAIPGSAYGYVANGPFPRVWFKNQVYGEYGTGSAFSIYRSPQSGSQYMTWELVANNGFGDPGNHGLAFIAEFNGKLVAGTTETRSSGFGDPSGFGTGVEIWESATGNSGSWTQVNADGFGTQTTIVGSSKALRTNQDIGSAQVHNGHLYVGTKSHFGAEVWRYNGTGTTGWTNVTPTWAGACDVTACNPGRNNAMAVFQGQLYLGEGYPTANIARFNGTSWAIEVSGPNPFDPQNGGISSLAVFNGVLYAATMHAPYSGVTQGDQVWATPFASPPSFCVKPQKPELRYDPPKIKFLLPSHQVELWTRVSNVGDGLFRGGWRVEIRKGEMVVMSQDVPALGPEKSVEFSVAIDLSPGTNLFSLTLYSEQAGSGQQSSTLHFSLEGGAR